MMKYLKIFLLFPLLSIAQTNSFKEKILTADEHNFQINNNKKVVQQNGVDFYHNSDITNIEVSRNPEQILLTKDDKYAFVRCRWGMSVDLVDINRKNIIKKFSIPYPTDMAFSNDREKIFVLSQVYAYSDPVQDSALQNECTLQWIWCELSAITIIDVKKQLIEKEILITNKDENGPTYLLVPKNKPTIFFYLYNELVEYDLNKEVVLNRYPFNGGRNAIIDNKTNKLLLLKSDSVEVIDILNHY